MRAVWSDRPNCSHNVSQKVKRIGRFSDSIGFPCIFQRKSGFAKLGVLGPFWGQRRDSQKFAFPSFIRVLVARAIRNAIRANRFARIIRY